VSGDEHRATGWDPGTPITDNFVRAISLSMADVGLGAALGHRTWQTNAYGAVDYGVPAGFGNIIVLLQPLPYDGWEAVLEELEALFAGGTGEVELFSPWPTPDLRPRGWHLHGHPPLMTRPAGPPAAWPEPEGLRIERVADAAGLADFERTMVEAFPMPDAEALLPGRLIGPRLLEDRRWQFFVGYVGDQPVTTAAALVDHGHNSVNFVSTRPGARGRGYGEAATWWATRADPALPAALLASDPGRPVYERMGYRSVLRFTLWGLPRS
jgi:GNAT superfamily N-acetyltransferase